MREEELVPSIFLFTSTTCGREMGAGGGICCRPVLPHIVTEAVFSREPCVNTAHLREKEGESRGVACFLYRICWSGLHCFDRVDPHTLTFLSASPLVSLPWNRTADRLLAENGGIPGDTGIFGETAYTPGGSPRFSSKGKRDSRRKLLLNLTYLNLALALVLIIVGSAGPQYPGHSGTTNNPVSTWVSPRSANVSVLT